MRLLLAAALLLVAEGVLAQDLGAAAERERQRRAAVRAQWVEFTDPAGAYVARFPVRPQLRSVPVPGGTATATGYFADTGVRAYSVSYHEEPAESVARGAPAVLAGMRNGFLKGTRWGVLDGEKAVTLATHPGIEIAVREASLVWRVRFFVAGRRVFSLTTCARAADDEVDGAQRFFDSFALRP